MLKMLKYEMIHSWRSFGIIYMIFLACCILFPVVWVGNDMRTMVDSTLGIVSIVTLVLMIFSIMASMVVNIALNYNRSMFKRPGYLTMTLPVSTHQLLLSKLLADILWIMISTLVLILGFILIAIMASILQGIALPSWQDWLRLLSEIRINFSGFFETLLVIIYGLLALSNGIMLIYFVITAVQTKFTPKHKTAISVAMYFAITILLSLISTNITRLMYTMNISLTGLGAEFYMVGCELLMFALYYLGIWFILEKKLEIE